jgi:hypothetical protein
MTALLVCTKQFGIVVILWISVPEVHGSYLYWAVDTDGHTESYIIRVVEKMPLSELNNKHK